MKRNNRNIFGLFVFWKTEINNKQQKERKKIETWMYKVPTRYDM